MIEKLDGMTKDLVKENIEKLKELFPTIVKEDKIDFEELQLILGEDINNNKEQYSFVWNGKTEATKLAQKRSTGTLRPCIEESKNWDTTKNIYIEGDNLEVLKLLQSSYNGRIKMIYIDPPYNTGHDFVYKDNFEDNISNYKEVTGQAQKSNADTDGRYHTNWLNMIYPRLKLARNLLTDDGVIFISIDDNELFNLKKICDEIFGEINFVGCISRATGTTTGQDANKLGSSLDYCIVYSKTEDFTLSGIKLTDEDANRFNGEDERGKYSVLQLRKTGNADTRTARPNMFYPVIAPDGELVYPFGPTNYLSRWRVGKDKYKQLEKDGYIEWKRNEKIEQVIVEGFKKSQWVPYVKYYLEGRTKQVSNLFQDIEGNKKGSITLKSLFENKLLFDNPKPMEFLDILLNISTNKDSIILDFFSGSATTAHAIFKLNSEDGGNRKFICVQLPEKTEDDSEAYRQGYKNICEIGKERIRRAGQKIIEDKALLNNAYKDNKLEPMKAYAQFTTSEKAIEEQKNIEKYFDVGFKVFKLDSSNLKKWNNTPTKDADEVAKRIQISLDYLENDRTELDLVYEIMLKYGIDLTLPITKTANGKAYIVEAQEYKLLICSEMNLKLEDIEEFANESVGTYLFADRCFSDDNLLINAQEILKAKNKEMRLF